jgi:hypothetical protein
MAKNGHTHRGAEVQTAPTTTRYEAEVSLLLKIKRKEYEREMRVLHGELVAMQEWVKASGWGFAGGGLT